MLGSNERRGANVESLYLWLVFALAPFYAIRRIYRKYFRAGRLQATAALELTR
jgi:hypothetical protein